MDKVFALLVYQFEDVTHKPFGRHFSLPSLATDMFGWLHYQSVTLAKPE